MKKLILIPTIIISALLLNACKKKTELPPTRNLADGTNYSVTALKAVASSTNNHRFTTESYFTGVVIADEVSGNFYKEVYVRDAANTGALHLTFLFRGSNFFIGDSIRLNLKGYDVNFDPASEILEIDSVSFDKSVSKFATGADPKPIANLTLAQLSSTATPYTNYLGELITVSNVQFMYEDANVVYADPIKQLSINRTLEDCLANTLVVRTSNYALFATEKTPKGFGSITGIATRYNGTDQLAIRTPKENKLTNVSPCPTYLSKRFEDNLITSYGWQMVAVTNPSVTWTIGTFSTVHSVISGYLGTNQNAENWLISPSIDLSSSTNPNLNFRTAAKFSGTPLQVLVSTNYTSGLPSTATWTVLPGVILGATSPGFVWANSGQLSLNNYKTTNTRIAFKYLSTTGGASTYELDDIIIK